MTEPSAAEFARFVQEAKEQRARADALTVALAQLRERLVAVGPGYHNLAFHSRVMGSGQFEDCQEQVCRWVRAVLAADQPAAAGAELLAAIDVLQRRWDAVCDCVNEFEPEDMGACGEAKDLLDDAILHVLRARASRSVGEGPGREGEQA